MKKFIFGCIMLLAVVLGGCSTTNKLPNADKILADYNAKHPSYSYAGFYKAEILSENKYDDFYVADVNFLGKNENVEYQHDTTIYYKKVDGQGWVYTKRQERSISHKLVKGRTTEEIQADLDKNGGKYTDEGTNIKFISSEIDNNENKEFVRIAWDKCRGDLESHYEAILTFYYLKEPQTVVGENGSYVKKVWDFQGRNITDNQHTILNMENTSWKYKNSNTWARPNPDFLTLNSITENGTVLTFTYGGNTYTGYANSANGFEDGHVAYKISGNSEIESAELSFSVNDTTDYKGCLILNLGSTYISFVK